MPTLKELRQWLRGKPVESLPEWPEDKRKKGKIDVARMKDRRNRNDGRFRLSTDGRDAMLKFGEHQGAYISDLAETAPDYLRWILRASDPDRAPFPEALLEVVRAHLKNTKPPRTPFDADEDEKLPF